MTLKDRLMKLSKAELVAIVYSEYKTICGDFGYAQENCPTDKDKVCCACKKISEPAKRKEK